MPLSTLLLSNSALDATREDISACRLSPYHWREVLLSEWYLAVHSYGLCAVWLCLTLYASLAAITLLSTIIICGLLRCTYLLIDAYEVHASSYLPSYAGRAIYILVPNLLMTVYVLLTHFMYQTARLRARLPLLNSALFVHITFGLLAVLHPLVDGLLCIIRAPLLVVYIVITLIFANFICVASAVYSNAALNALNRRRPIGGAGGKAGRYESTPVPLINITNELDETRSYCSALEMANADDDFDSRKDTDSEGEKESNSTTKVEENNNRNVAKNGCAAVTKRKIATPVIGYYQRPFRRTQILLLLCSLLTIVSLSWHLADIMGHTFGWRYLTDSVHTWIVLQSVIRVCEAFYAFLLIFTIHTGYTQL